MRSEHEKAARVEPFSEFVRDPALQCVIEIGEGEVATQDS
jgi:hypothetical protein